ncbi:phosphatidylinositol 4-phosphate 3-kinase C2 domain-containing subunit alpha-like [Tubulanus polymorphus]|uniref:phosphatidylinositol 4-phosphate 3-kinase C2 domain-containing subunit alpha-like n=1 Tax=Tubulanus polymorphus TaxID=672921 RepID=UPI003DA28472
MATGGFNPPTTTTAPLPQKRTSIGVAYARARPRSPALRSGSDPIDTTAAGIQLAPPPVPPPRRFSHRSTSNCSTSSSVSGGAENNSDLIHFSELEKRYSKTLADKFDLESLLGPSSAADDDGDDAARRKVSDPTRGASGLRSTGSSSTRLNGPCVDPIRDLQLSALDSNIYESLHTMYSGYTMLGGSTGNLMSSDEVSKRCRRRDEVTIDGRRRSLTPEPGTSIALTNNVPYCNATSANNPPERAPAVPPRKNSKTKPLISDNNTCGGMTKTVTCPADLMNFSPSTNVGAAAANKKTHARNPSLSEFDPIKKHSSATRTVDTSAQNVSSSSTFRELHILKASSEYDEIDAIYDSARRSAADDPIYQNYFGEIQDPFSVDTLTLIGKTWKEQSLHSSVKELDDDKPPLSPPPRPALPALKRCNSTKEALKKRPFEPLKPLTRIDREAAAFCDTVNRLKAELSATGNLSTNPGLVISPRVVGIPHKLMTFKLTVITSFSKEPVVFTCDLSSSVEHLINHVLYSVCDDLENISASNCILKVYGSSEFLINDSTIGDYEYVQTSLELSQEIRFSLLNKEFATRPLKRTVEDSREKMTLPQCMDGIETQVATIDSISILMENYTSECNKIKEQAMSNGCKKLQPRGVVQSAKAICAILGGVETIEVMRSVKHLECLCHEGVNFEKLQNKVGDDYASSGLAAASNKYDELESGLEVLTLSVTQLVDMYCRAHQNDYHVGVDEQLSDEVEVTNLLDNLIVHIGSVHKFPPEWQSSYEHLRVICSLFYGGRNLCPPVASVKALITTEGFSSMRKVVWDEWLQFPCVSLCTLPREAKLCFTLFGFKTIPGSGSEVSKQVKNPLGWVAIPMFDFDRKLAQGGFLLPLWPNEAAKPTSNCQAYMKPDAVVLQVNLPELDSLVRFPPVLQNGVCTKAVYDDLDDETKEMIQDILAKDTITFCNEDENELLWEKRHHLMGIPEALPKVLLAAHSWNWSCLADIYAMIKLWAPLPPDVALELITPVFPDEQVRSHAVHWLKAMSNDTVFDYLPQLVQALKFEIHHNSSLSEFLLERSMCNVRVGQRLFWLLRDALTDDKYRWRYQLMMTALKTVVGSMFNNELHKQEKFVRILASVAEKVKTHKDKEATLVRSLVDVYDMLKEEPVRLPLHMATIISGIDVKSCSYFASNAFPLKLVFKNEEKRADSIYTMFKYGDDLRQDVLTLQLIRIMDKQWLKAGLDLSIIVFRCLATGDKQGLIELVTESDTLRKIQTTHGLTGSFKDRPIAEWLMKHNPTELEYKMAVRNFTRSCAGYCVATYVLGICDRHNDNIMLKQTGHMFHIDFGKFLGDSQMFGNIKRDRVPFVFTSDMAYVINGGDKPSQKFQEFVDLCCQAFNVIRRQGNMFLNLIRLMTDAGIPGVNQDATKYVQKALLPDCSDAEATVIFTRMLEDSLKSISTQINFFIHNLAQMRFSNHDEGALLSYCPKVYSVHSDGKIKQAAIFGYQKRYNPDKYYIYIIKVERAKERVPTFIWRKYSEFDEFHQKLVITFPLAKLPPLSGKVIGRSNVKSVAEKRKQELDVFMRELLKTAPEISECDLVYTFFHPLMRDEQEGLNPHLQKIKELEPARPRSSTIQGQVKLSIQYKDTKLNVMIMHAKDLVPEDCEMPDPYVKLYLLPDFSKETKQKTTVVKNSSHPTFNQMLVYETSFEEVRRKVLQVAVWSHGRLKENEFLGACYINLNDIDLKKEMVAWFQLGSLPYVGPKKSST